MHVVQANLLPVPEGWMHADVLRQWHSLVDIAEIAASGGVRVSVLQAASREDRIVRDGIEYRFVDVSEAKGAPERSHRLAAALQELGADVLHVQGLAFGGDAFAISRRLPRLPILCQDHADHPPSRWRPWRRLQWRRWFAAVSAVSFTAPEQAQPFIDAGVFAKRMQVFAIPESTSRFTPGDRGLARAATGLHGDPCVLWVGHLARGKDPLAVIDGIARAALRLPGLQLWCAYGTAPLLDAVHQRMAAYPQLAGRVHLLGKVPHARIESLMRAADLFVSGSHAEGSGYALLEALACDATPVVTDIPPFRALTGDGAIGRLWPPGDPERLSGALVDAWSNRAPPGRVRDHFDATLSFAAVGRRWADAYARVVDSHARGAR
ncbi:glycosyltransferase family 4 protein [Pseudoxanthomonas sangjuensis]